MRFLHTADWQIGMKALHVGEAGARVREERLAAARRVVEATRDAGADFTLVAGDTFEDSGVDRVLVQRAVDIPHERRPELRCPRQVVRRTISGIVCLVTTQEREDVKTGQLGMKL
jgi:hypothetical protein